MNQFADRKFDTVKIFWIRPETDGRTGIALADFTDDFQSGFLVTAGKRHIVFLAIAPDPYFQVFGKCIDNGHTDAMQTTGEFIMLAGKFTASMQAGKNTFHTRDFLAWMNIRWHTTAIIGDGD